MARSPPGPGPRLDPEALGSKRRAHGLAGWLGAGQALQHSPPCSGRDRVHRRESWQAWAAGVPVLGGEGLCPRTGPPIPLHPGPLGRTRGIHARGSQRRLLPLPSRPETPARDQPTNALGPGDATSLLRTAGLQAHGFAVLWGHTCVPVLVLQGLSGDGARLTRLRADPGLGASVSHTPLLVPPRPLLLSGVRSLLLALCGPPGGPSPALRGWETPGVPVGPAARDEGHAGQEHRGRAAADGVGSWCPDVPESCLRYCLLLRAEAAGAEWSKSLVSSVFDITGFADLQVAQTP